MPKPNWHMKQQKDDLHVRYRLGRIVASFETFEKLAGDIVESHHLQELVAMKARLEELVKHYDHPILRKSLEDGLI